MIHAFRWFLLTACITSLLSCVTKTEKQQTPPSIMSYKAPAALYKEIDSDGNTARVEIVGTNVTFVVDSLNSEYSLSFTNKNGEVASMKYRYRKVQDSELRVYVVENEVGDFYFLFDRMDVGRIMLQPAKADAAGNLHASKAGDMQRGIYVRDLTPIRVNQ